MDFISFENGVSLWSCLDADMTYASVGNVLSCQGFWKHEKAGMVPEFTLKKSW